MAFWTKQIFLLFFIIGLTLADFAANDLRRYAKAKSAATAAGGRLMRPVRLVNRRPGGDVRIKTNNRDVMTPAESRPVDQRFTNFGLNQNEANTNFGGRPNFRPTNSYNPQSQRDGAEYDNYGNRKKERYGLGTQNLPRGYDRHSEVPSLEPSPAQVSIDTQEFENRPRYQYPEPPTSRRRVDTNLKAVIDDVDPAMLESLPVEQDWASGPAFAPSNLSPTYAQARQGGVGHGDLQASVLAGAQSYNPDGVYQSEDRIQFQIHGQDGPHSYRYGYDTGNGYNRQFRYEERSNEGYVKGRYGFFDQQGKLNVVNYTADPEKGFHAEGDSVPKYPH
jgi:hypothetical protein